MTIEFRLKQILEGSERTRHVTVQEIADRQDLNRHTVSKIYHNKAAQVPLRTLEKLCQYLEEQGLVRAEDLPGALLARRPSDLFQAIAAPRVVTLYLGQRLSRRPPFAWVARDDSSAASAISTKLSRQGGTVIKHVHVPTHVGERGYQQGVDAGLVARDRATAIEIFERLRRDPAMGTPILIGSAIANMLVELFLADLFVTEPYRAEGSRVPFYLRFPDRSNPPPSCCGGEAVPEGAADHGPGIYYRDGAAWKHLPSRRPDLGVGACVMRRDPGLGRLELAVFGLSAIATAAMGQLLCELPDDLWPPSPVGRGLEAAVYLYSLEMEGNRSGEESIEDITLRRAAPTELRFELPNRREPPPPRGEGRRRRRGDG